MKTERTDVYEQVTATVLAELENGKAPWHRPWNAAGLPVSLSTNRPYRGVNVWLLAVAGLDYTSTIWGTYNKIAEKGGQVRKGEHSTVVTFWKKFLAKDKDNPDDKGHSFMMLKFFRVFNVEQADWLDGMMPTLPAPDGPELEPVDAAEAIVAGYLDGPRIVRKPSDRAFYMPGPDVVTVPTIEQYQVVDEFYSTLFHELTHSTGHEKRLARKGVATFTHFGDDLYSKEELVAELGAALLCGMAGLDPTRTIPNSAAYLRSWSKAFTEDKRLLVQAAGQAQKAADRVLGALYVEQSEEAAA
jgi:antirestriction protein ArdC